MTPAQRKRWGDIPEECPAFEFSCGSYWEIREAMWVQEPFGAYIQMRDPPTNMVGGNITSSREDFYTPLTRAARELVAALANAAL